MCLDKSSVENLRDHNLEILLVRLLIFRPGTKIDWLCSTVLWVAIQNIPLTFFTFLKVLFGVKKFIVTSQNVLV
jgi:hypothetical protein